MPKVFRIDDLEMKKWQDRMPEFSWRTSANLGEISGSKCISFDVRALDPAKYSFPYHFHRAAEELFVILSGVATLRSPEGFRKVGKGDIIFFEEGSSGAHQLRNDGDVPCVYLDIRTIHGIDVCEYPDSRKVSILPFREVFEASSKVDYFKGEGGVAGKWPAPGFAEKKGP
ncbi:MAG: cupin domain-containing protein [Syntrophorhabdales bacterium]|jgi:uncharacterized cupin superfamily protein